MSKNSAAARYLTDIATGQSEPALVGANATMPAASAVDKFSEVSGTTSHPFICNPYVDSGTHEADVHGATNIGRPPREIWLASLDWMLPDPTPVAPGTLSIITPDGTYTLGSTDPVTEVETDTNELFRAIFGRRSTHQIHAWNWSSPPHATAWSTELPRLPQTPIPLTD